MENKSGIGIMTFHFAHNFGAMLQAYALKTYITENIGRAEIINYVPEYMKMKYFYVSPFRVFATLKRSVVRSYFRQYSNIKKFRLFERQYLTTDKYISKERLGDKCKNMDLIVFGSDQIWNMNITKKDMSYFADFLPERKAVAYAASCGNTVNSEFFAEVVNNYSKKFKKISVREKDAEAFLRNECGIEAQCVLDPVFLLEPGFWAKLAEKGKTETEKNYIMFYTVQDNSELASECNEFAKRNNAKVYSLHGEMKKCNKQSELRKGTGPLEFLYHIKNAGCVYTNSFHALAFSIIFQKKVYLRLHSETGNRVVDLLNECGISWSGRGLLEIDGRDCLEKLKGSIERSEKFLTDSLK